jgi:hypothetical protein
MRAMPSNDLAALIDEIAGIAVTLDHGEVLDTLAALRQRQRGSA